MTQSNLVLTVVLWGTFMAALIWVSKHNQIIPKTPIFKHQGVPNPEPTLAKTLTFGYPKTVIEQRGNDWIHATTDEVCFVVDGVASCDPFPDPIPIELQEEP